MLHRPDASAAAMEAAPTDLLGIHSLPEHMLRHCFQALPSREVLNAASVCREWRAVAQCDSLWQHRFVADFSRSSAFVGSRYGSSTTGSPAAPLFPSAQPPPPADAPAGQATAWRAAYRERAAAEDNWRAGRCRWQRLRGHKDYIRCAQLQGSRLATCSGSYLHKDVSIRVWDVESGACLERMAGHEGTIWSMQFDGRRVASCDDEGAVRLWDMGSHRVGVSAAQGPFSLKCIGMDGAQVAAAGESGALALWSLDEIQRTMEDAELEEPDEAMGEAGGDAAAEGLPAWRDVPLDGEGGAPPARARPPHEPVESADSGCLQLDGGLCATGTAGGCVHLWSTAGDELEHRRRLPGHEHGVSTLSFQRETGWLVAGTGGGAVRVWSLESGARLHSLVPPIALAGRSADIMCHQQSGHLVAAGSAAQSVHVWDLRAPGQPRLPQHVVPLGSLPYCLQMDDWRLVAGCADGTAKVADLRTSGITLHARTLLPAHRERVWALALSETRLISAGLDGQVVVRSFLPGDVAAQEAGGHSESDEESSEDEGSLASAYTSSDSEEDSEEDAGWAGSSDSEGHDG